MRSPADIGCTVKKRSEEHTSELQSHRDLHSFPTRRSSDLLEQYVRYFDPRFVGLSGTVDQIDEVARRYRVHRQKEQSAPGGYSVSHSAHVYLLDQRGRVRALFGDGTKPAEIADGVRQLLADSAVPR